MMRVALKIFGFLRCTADDNPAILLDMGSVKVKIFIRF